MSKYISEVQVCSHKDDEHKLQSQGFVKSNVNLTRGARGKDLYLWYKRGDVAITRIQLTFNVQMSVGLIKAGYIKICIPDIITPGGPLYMWFFQGTGEYHTPIVDMDLTADAESEALKLKQGWERLACDLFRNAGEEWIHIWVKREKPTYICDVAVTDSFRSDEEYLQNGFIRVDEDAHRGSGSDFVFFWYRQIVDPKRAITDLKVSTTEQEFQDLQELNYLPVNVNFNEGGSNPIYLWYAKEKSKKPVKAIILLVNVDAAWIYEKAITVIKKNLNPGSKGRLEYLCFSQ